MTLRGERKKSARSFQPGKQQGPSEYALARTVLRFVITLRCGGVLAASIAAVVDDGTDVSRTWQVVVLASLTVWAACFALIATHRGLSLTLVVGDAAVVSVALLAQSRCVPALADLDETTWAMMLASTAIYVAQLALPTVTGLPLAGGVIIAYVIGVCEPTSHLRVLFVQATVVSAMMWLLRRGGRRADAIVADRDFERRRALAAAARRADERHQRALLHDSVLSVLTMVASSAIRTDSPALRRSARQALHTLEECALPAVDPLTADLWERLAALISRLSPELLVELLREGTARADVPEPVAEALAGAVGEALRNVERHAGARRVSVRVRYHDRSVAVDILDDGVGFDPAGVPLTRRGIRKSIVERVKVVGGDVDIRSRSQAGTRIMLWWPGG